MVNDDNKIIDNDLINVQYFNDVKETINKKTLLKNISLINNDSSHICHYLSSNFFDKSLEPYTSSYSSYIELPTGIRVISTVNGPSNSNNSISFIALDVSNFIGKTIKLSAHAKSSSINKGFMYLRLINESGDTTSTYGTIISSSTLDGDISVIYTIPSGIEDYHYLRVTLYSTRNSEVHVGDYVDYTNLMLSEGSESFPYEPYEGCLYGLELYDTIEPYFITNNYYINCGVISIFLFLIILIVNAPFIFIRKIKGN